MDKHQHQSNNNNSKLKLVNILPSENSNENSKSPREKSISLKSSKLLDMMKNLYGKETGNMIKSLVMNKHEKKILLNNPEENFPNIQFTSQKVNNSHDMIINSVQDLKKSIIKKLNVSSKTDLKQENSQAKLHSKYFMKEELRGFDENSNQEETMLLDNNLSKNSPIIIKNFQPNSILKEKRGNRSSSEINNSKSIFKDIRNNDNKFYCPFCQHCNTIKDQNLDDYLYAIKDSKTIISKAFDYLVNSDILNDLDLFKRNITDLTKDNTFDKVDILLSNFPKNNTSNRVSYQILAHFLNALLEDKVSIENIINIEVFEKFKNSLIAKGEAFEEKDDQLGFDKELENMFDEKTKESLQHLYKKKLLNIKRKSNFNLKNSSETEIDQYYLFKKKFLILFLIFIQILSEISVESKERAILLYKFFKLYFVEKEKKYTLAFNKLQEKIKYYKELCKIVIQQKNKHLEKVELINEVLFTNKLTKDNLQQHKKLIQDLLQIIKDKREEIYLLTSTNENLEKEIKFWIYDFDALKINTDIRKKMKELNVEKMSKAINEEMAHKNLSRDQKASLINADRFLLISGQRGYFYETKAQLSNEVGRLNQLYRKHYFKKKEWKEKYLSQSNEFFLEKNRLVKEIENYRDKITKEKISNSVQTDIDFYSFNKILKNHDSIIFVKSITKNKLNDFVDRIKYNCSKARPISKKSLMFLIPELYNEKIDEDVRMDVDNKRRSQFDVFFYNYMHSKFKLKKITKKHCEEALMSILIYCKEDIRVDLFRRFLGIGDGKLRREILDIYLSLIKSLEISFFKLFEEETSHYTMNLETCFEIYKTKLLSFNIFEENKDILLRNTKIFENDKEIIKVENDFRTETFMLTRFFNRSYIYINDLITKYKNGESYENINILYDQFISINEDFKVNLSEFHKIIIRYIETNIKSEVNLDSFFQFYKRKFSFKIKIFDFLEFSLNNIINTFNCIEGKIGSLFDLVDTKKEGLLYYKEFEELINKIIKKTENKWDIDEYFKNALNETGKDFVTKEEFLIFALANNLIFESLLKSRREI